MHIAALNPPYADRERRAGRRAREGEGDRPGADRRPTRRTPASRPTSSRRSPRASSRPGSPRTCWSSSRWPTDEVPEEDGRRSAQGGRAGAGAVRPLQGRGAGRLIESELFIHETPMPHTQRRQAARQNEKRRGRTGPRPRDQARVEDRRRGVMPPATREAPTSSRGHPTDARPRREEGLHPPEQGRPARESRIAKKLWSPTGVPASPREACKSNRSVIAVRPRISPGPRSSPEELAPRCGTAAALRPPAASPRRVQLRVLRRQHVPLRVRHQAEHAAGRVAQAGDVALRAVGVDRIRRPARSSTYRSTTCPVCSRPLQYPLLPADEVALAVGDRQVQPVDALEEGALVRRGLAGASSGPRTCRGRCGRAWRAGRPRRAA